MGGGLAMVLGPDLTINFENQMAVSEKYILFSETELYGRSKSFGNTEKAFEMIKWEHFENWLSWPREIFWKANLTFSEIKNFVGKLKLNIFLDYGN